MTSNRTIVIGIDGAHYELVGKWIKKGRLPNIEAVFEDGLTADLRSVLPPVTSPNWKAYATGKNPGKLGIYWWENIDVENRRVYYPSERKHSQTEYWERLADSYRVGVLGVPTTHPPQSIGEFYIAGAPDGENSGFAYPEKLEKHLVDEYGYRVLRKNELRVDPDAAAEEILDLIDLRFTVAHDLFHEYDLEFMQATTFYINSLHHYLWDDEYTLQGWQQIDEHVGRFMEEDINIVLMSDHGSTEIDTVFHINTWLEQEGYLELDTATAEYVYQLGIDRDRILRLASWFGIQDLAKRFSPEWLLRYIPDSQGELSHESKTDNIDWEQSTAVASGQGPVYVIAESPTGDRIRRELKEKLAALEDPAGHPIATEVLTRDEVYNGSYIDEAPDLVVDQRPGVHIQGHIGRNEVFTDPADDGWRGENKPTGLFAASGPSFRSGEVDQLSILDIAPTMLHLFGMAVPEDMDGSVRQDVFDPMSEPADSVVDYTSTDPRKTEKRRIRKVARGLDL